MNVQESILREKIDPKLTDDTLSTLLSRATGERVRTHGFEILTGGCWNRVIGVDAGDRRLVVKISPRHPDKRIRREYSVLVEFRAKTDMPVPEPLFLDDRQEFLPGTSLVMTRIPGKVMHQCFGSLDQESRDRITRQIAGHVADLHLHRSVGFGGVEVPQTKRTSAWPDFWLPRFDAVLNECETSGEVPAELIAGAREVRPALAPVLEIGNCSTMTHYDIWSGNVMIDLGATEPTVSGYIDIPGHFADYARELSFAMLFGLADRAFFETYAERHTIDDGFELRASIYNLKMNLKHIQMYPSEWYYQAGAAQCLDTIRKCL